MKTNKSQEKRKEYWKEYWNHIPLDNPKEISKFAYFAFELNKNILEKLYGKRK